MYTTNKNLSEQNRIYLFIQSIFRWEKLTVCTIRTHQKFISRFD